MQHATLQHATKPIQLQ